MYEALSRIQFLCPVSRNIDTLDRSYAKDDFAPWYKKHIVLFVAERCVCVR